MEFVFFIPENVKIKYLYMSVNLKLTLKKKDHGKKSIAIIHHTFHVLEIYELRDIVNTFNQSRYFFNIPNMLDKAKLSSVLQMV